MFRKVRWSTCLLVCIFTVSLTSQSTLAATQCPLTNPRYYTLRSAVAALSARVTLPAGCQEKLELATKTLNEVSATLPQLKEEGNTAEAAKMTSMAAGAMTGISQVMNSACGRQLLNTGDYFVAFLDTFNQLTPYFMLFGGPELAPTVMGMSIVGNLVKTIVNLFAANSTKMDTEKKRAIFIDNSCGFYLINENVKALIDLQAGGDDSIKAGLEQAKQKVEDLKSQVPDKIENEITTLLAQVEKQIEDINVINKQIEIFSDPEFIVFLVQARLNESPHESPHEAASKLLGILLDETKSEDSVVLQYLEFYHRDVINMDVKDVESAKKWLNKQIMPLLQRAQIRGVLALAEDPEMKATFEWEKKMGEAKKQVEEYGNRLNYFTSLMSSGVSIETSEIMSGRDTIVKALFGRRGRNKSLVRSWLIFKFDESLAKLKIYKKEVIELLKRYPWLQDGEKPKNMTPGESANACGQSRATWVEWFKAATHIRAARTYCITFDNIINPRNNPKIDDYCFNSDFDHSKIGVRKWANNIPQQKHAVALVKDQADDILKFRKKLNCRKSTEMSLMK